MQSNNFYSIIY